MLGVLAEVSALQEKARSGAWEYVHPVHGGCVEQSVRVEHQHLHRRACRNVG